jgi:sugar lactone lactonase YvrE
MVSRLMWRDTYGWRPTLREASAVLPSGEAVATCVVPGAKMTSCPAFGGEDFRTLFLASIASEGSTGHVYKVQVDVIRRHEYEA